MKLESQAAPQTTGRPLLTGLVILAGAALASFALAYVSPWPRSSASVTDLTIRGEPLVFWGTPRTEVSLRPERLRAALARLDQHVFSSWNQVTHGLRLWGTTGDRAGDWDGGRMLGVLCSAELAQEAFGFAPHLLNRNGLQFGHRFVEGRLQGEKHLDESVSILGEIGIPSRQAIVVWDRSTTVGDAVRAAALNCDLDQELEFSVAVFAHYLPPQRAWRNKFGDEISFDALSDRLCRKPLGTGGCGGCHALYSLALVLAADRNNPLLSNPVREQVRARIREALAILRRTQRESGAWDLHWYDPALKAEEEFSTIAMATGHTLEWLAVAPADLFDDPEMISRGCEAALGLILDAPPAQLDEEFNYYTHLANALKLWCPHAWRDAHLKSRDDMSNP